MIKESITLFIGLSAFTFLLANISSNAIIILTFIFPIPYNPLISLRLLGKYTKYSNIPI